MKYIAHDLRSALRAMPDLAFRGRELTPEDAARWLKATVAVMDEREPTMTTWMKILTELQLDLCVNPQNGATALSTRDEILIPDCHEDKVASFFLLTVV